MSSKFIKSGLIYTLGNIFVQGLIFLTLPIYSRIISPEVFGQYSLYTSWLSLIGLFIGLQTQGSLSIAKVKFENKYDEYSVNMLTISNLFFVTVFIFAYIFKDIFSNILDMASNIIILMVLQSYAVYLLGFLGQYFIQDQKSGVTLVYSAVSAIANVILSMFLIFSMEDDFFARIYGGLIPVAILGLVVLSYFYSKKNWQFNKSHIKFGLAVSIPLIFHHLGHNILNQFDRIMLGNMLDMKDVALYSFAYSLGLVLQIVLGSVNTVWVPWFFKARKGNDSQLPYYISRYLTLGLFLTVGYMTIFPEISYFMGGEVYKDSVSITPLIILSCFLIFLYTFPVNIQFYYANTRLIPAATLFAGLVNILLNYIFIPRFGIFGAAIATIIAYFVLLLVHHVVAKIKYNYEDVKLKQYVVFCILASGYTYLMMIFTSDILVRYIIGVVTLGIFMYILRVELNIFIKKFLKKKEK